METITVEHAIGLLTTKESRNADAFKEAYACRKHVDVAKEPLADYFSFITTESAYWLRSLPVTWTTTTQFRSMKLALIELSKEPEVIAAVSAPEIKKMVKAVNFIMSNNGLNDIVATRSGVVDEKDEESTVEVSDKIRQACIICSTDNKMTELINLFWDNEASVETHDKIFECISCDASLHEVYKLLRGIQ